MNFQSFENVKLPDLHARWHNKPYDQLGLPQGMPGASADIQKTVWKHMTIYNIQMRKNDKGHSTRLAFEREND